MDNFSLPVIDVSDLPQVIEVIDVGDVRWPYVEVLQRKAPEFGKSRTPDFAKKTYKLQPTDSPDAAASDSFLDELAKIRNTPLTLSEAAAEFGELLRASGRKPTHVVKVGKNLYAVIAAQDLHIRVGMVEDKPVSALISLFHKFPVFRVRSAR